MRVCNGGANLVGDGPRHFMLQIHDFAHLARIALSPKVAIPAGLDQSSVYVFPKARGQKGHTTAEGIEKHLQKRLKLDGLHSPHSWRSAFSTWANAQTTDDG